MESTDVEIHSTCESDKLSIMWPPQMAGKNTAAGVRAFQSWRERTGTSISAVSRAIGDHGGQLQRWDSGDRQTLPLYLKARLALFTGIRLVRLLGSEERAIVREIVSVLERDKDLAA